MVEVNGQEEQGKLILRYNQNKSRKTESLDPKDEGDGGDTCIAVKREQGSLLLGSQKTNRSHLGSEVDWENTGKDFHTRQDSFCTLSPITYLYTLSLLPLSLFLPQSCLCTHAHTHTYTYTLLQLKGSYMPQVAGRCSSFKHLWKTRLRCLDLGLNWQCLCLCLLRLEGKTAYSISFLSPSQHLLLDTICSASTWHSINACWMADFSRLPHPFLPTPTALL